MYFPFYNKIKFINVFHILHVHNYTCRAAFERVSKTEFKSHGTESVINVCRTRLPSIRPEDTGYDPREHRHPQNPIKVWMAYFNLLRTMCGAGMLGMPLAISQAGIVLGPALTLFTGLLLIHTHTLLLDSLNEISRQLKIPYVSYRYGFRLALLHGPPIFHGMGKHGPAIIATFMILSQLGICTVFVTLTTDSLRDIMDWQSNVPAIISLLFPYILLEFFMKSLSIISYVAMFGNFLNLVGLMVIIVYISIVHEGEVISGTTDSMALLFAFGTLLFNLSAVGVILSVDKALKNSKRMTAKFGVINVGIFIPTMISIVFGSLGYWAFGTMEENILRSLPYEELSSMVAIALYLVAVAFAYPVQCYPAIAVIMEILKNHDPSSPPSEKKLKLVESICRPIFVVLSFIICYFVPFQGPFVAFVGNLCTSVLSLIFPALMDICLRYPDNLGGMNIFLFKNLIIIGIGLTAAIFGVYMCSYLIYIRLLTRSSVSNQGFY